ncbi:hypothetical protein ACFFW8_14320 [Erwinia tracheiphila]|nr:hypothetical protein [Erwinia tracheiphila]UIA93477.1 hypothetical protein LU632_08210 [Erwinia tracheiphila]
MKKYIYITVAIMVAVLLWSTHYFQQKASQLGESLIAANKAANESNAMIVALRNRSTELSVIDW